MQINLTDRGERDFYSDSLGLIHGSGRAVGKGSMAQRCFKLHPAAKSLKGPFWQWGTTGVQECICPLLLHSANLLPVLGTGRGAMWRDLSHLGILQCWGTQLERYKGATWDLRSEALCLLLVLINPCLKTAWGAGGEGGVCVNA